MSLSFPPFTRAVKQLLIANGAVFLLMALLGDVEPGQQRSADACFNCVPRTSYTAGYGS